MHYILFPANQRPVPEPALYYCNYKHEEFYTCNPKNLQEN